MTQPQYPVTVPARVRWARAALAAVAWMFSAALLGQLFTAGLAVFVGPGWWLRHTAMVHWFEWLSPLALVLVFVARAPRGVKVLAGLTVVLLFAQYTTAGLRLNPARQRWAALHPVSAALLFWVATELARRAWRLARNA